MTRPEFDTVDEMIRARHGDPHVALLFEDERHTWAEHARASATRAALALAVRRSRSSPSTTSPRSAVPSQREGARTSWRSADRPVRAVWRHAMHRGCRYF